MKAHLPEIGEVEVDGDDLIHGVWFVVTRVALLGVCVAIPLGIAWLIGWLCSFSVD